MEKQNFHNKVESARLNHKEKIKAAIELIEQIEDPIKKANEYKKLSKISFRYFKKPQSQIDLENSLAKIKSLQNPDVDQIDK